MLEKNNACKKKVFIKVNSYVPYWHKYEDFKNLYACKKSLGGWALFTESHEIDLCLYFFGMPKKIYCKKYFSFISFLCRLKQKLGLSLLTLIPLKVF